MTKIYTDRNANAHTLNGMCKSLLKKYRDTITSCMPVTKNGKVKSVKVIYIEPTTKLKVPIFFHLDGEDILDSIENLKLINFKIQYLCEQESTDQNMIG